MDISTNLELKEEFLRQNNSLMSSASARLLTGSSEEFSQLEEIVSNLFNKEACLIFNTGYQCNLGVLSTLSQKGDVVLDMFLGSGTSAIEAINMGRRCIGVELKEEQVDIVANKFTEKQLVTDVNLICEDSASDTVQEKIQARLDVMLKDKAQFLVLHPPYDDIIKFSDKKEDLSNCASTEEFYELFKKVAKNGYDMLEKGRFAALIIGDKYANGEIVPLGADCAAKMREIGFKMKAVIVKNMEGNERAKGKTANLWRYRALNGGFYIFKHEYIYVFQKV